MVTLMFACTDALPQSVDLFQSCLLAMSTSWPIEEVTFGLLHAHALRHDYASFVAHFDDTGVPTLRVAMNNVSTRRL